MTNEEIDRLLEADNIEVIDAHISIVEIQKNKDNLLKLGIDWLDESLIGGANNKILFFGSRPGSGKTYLCSRIINNLLDRKLNPSPIRTLRHNLEMPTEALLLRQLSKDLNKKPSEILANEYTAEERIKVAKTVNTFKDKRIQNISRALEGDKYDYMISKFILDIDKSDEFYNKEKLEEFLKNGGKEEEYKPLKTKKIVLTDHIHVYLTKATIDSILTIQNKYKMLDKNLTFINFFQLNRETENLWIESKDKKVNPKNMLPSSGSIYLTDMLQMYADLVVGMVIPQIYELDEFVAVNKKRNPQLKEHFLDTDDSNVSSRVKGRNRIYYNLIKVRMRDDFDSPKVFCEILNLAQEGTADDIFKENKNPFKSVTPIFNSTPVFEKPPNLSSFEPSFEDLQGGDNPF